MRVPPTSRANQMASSQFISQTGGLYSSTEVPKKTDNNQNHNLDFKESGTPSFLNAKKSENVTQSMIFNPGPHPQQSTFSSTLSNMAKFTRGSV